MRAFLSSAAACLALIAASACGPSSQPGPSGAVGIRAPDDYTVEIQLEKPIGYLPDLVALQAVVPLRRDIIEKAGDAWAQDPSTYVGNGPFKMSEWVHQDHITLVQNPNYTGTKPKLEKVTMLMVGSSEADYAAYRNNERDWTLVPDADVQAVRGDAQLSKEAHEYTELSTWWLIMNNPRPPLDNPSVRKAFSRAIARQALIRDVAAGLGQPATSFIPPGMPGHSADLGKDIGFDPAAAKDLLKQAASPIHRSSRSCASATPAPRRTSRGVHPGSAQAKSGDQRHPGLARAEGVSGDVQEQGL